MISRLIATDEADLLRPLLEAATNPILIIDEAGMIVAANAAAERLLGYARGALDKRSVHLIGCGDLEGLQPCERTRNIVDPLVVVALRAGADRIVVRADGAKLRVALEITIVQSIRGPLRLIALADCAERRVQKLTGSAAATDDGEIDADRASAQRERLERYVTLSHSSGKIGIWELDLRTHVSTWDVNMYALYGIADTATQPTYGTWQAALHPDDRAMAADAIKADIEGGEPSDSEFRVVWPNGEIRMIRSLASVVLDDTGAPTRIIGTDWDVTELRSLSKQLREEKEALVISEARYRALTEAMPQLVWVIDAADDWGYVNARWTAYTGSTLAESRARGIDYVVAPEDSIRLSERRGGSRPTEFECEARLRRSDGVYRWHLVRSVPFSDASEDVGKWMITATDIEERKSAERTLAATVAELEHRAHHDPMTNLPNRKLLIDRLEHAMLRTARGTEGVVVYYVDLDRFKAINDTLGHAAGDRVLAMTGERIVSVLRAGDTASRVGGDEFIVVCETTSDTAEIARIAERILAAVTLPIDIGTERVSVEASIGASVYPADGEDAGTLIRKADAAMYAAKQSGRNAFRQYSIDAHLSIVAAAQFEAELRHAIGAGELVVHYQPILDLRTGRPSAAEALVRWQHPVRGLLPPSDFIAFAQERGLVAHIGNAVLAVACAMLERLRHGPYGDISLAVNISGNQIGSPGFVESVGAALATFAVDPRRLTIEITESVVMEQTPATQLTLDRLKALGINLSIDDFGTGYSSLAYIKKFPVTTLKIDRSFVDDIADDVTDQAIAKTIITLAHSLGMNVVAEGVETEEQLARLRSFGVDCIQGFLISKPLAALDYEHFLTTFAQCEQAANFAH